MKQNPTLIFRADYIEHHFEARVTLPPIFDALCNRLFLFVQIEPQRWYILKAKELQDATAELATLKFEVMKKVGDAVGNVQAYKL